MLWWLAWWGLAVGAPTVTGPDSTESITLGDDASDAVEQGRRDLEAGRFDAAGRAFRALAEAGGGPGIRYLEALAWYEGGQVRRARAALEPVLGPLDDRGEALALYALILADLGRGDEALGVLDRAAARAEASGDTALQARVLVDRGLVQLDRGALGEAERLFTAARDRAASAGDDATRELAEENLATLGVLRGGGAGGDVLSTVAAHLRDGDVEAARAAVPRPPETDRRGTVRALLADALIDRVTGAFDAAHHKLLAALGAARQGGMIRETGAVLAELGTLYSLAGRFDMALQSLQEAVGLVAGTSFRLREVAYRVEAGRAAVQLGDLQQARDQLAAAAVVAEGTEHPLGKARIAELQGQIAAEQGRVDEAAARFEEARGLYVDKGHPLDAARVATDLARLFAGRDEAARARWAALAEGHFAVGRNPAGPAHVRVASGLGFVEREQLDAALAAFLEAARLAEALDTDRGRQIAAHARENAAQALKALGHTDELADEMAQATELEAVMARQEAFSAAEARYDRAREAFDRGDHQAAREGFDGAVTAFRALGETGYAATARRGRGWASRNLALRLPPARAVPLFRQAAADGLAAGDAELQARGLVGLALSTAALDGKDAVERLTEAAEAAETAGLPEEAGRCLAEVAERAESLEARAGAARRVMELRGPGDPEAVYAMYSVAVDAYNDGDHALALALAREIAPHAGDLADSVEAVRSAAQEAMGSR
jgi:tetratricopeptide (TPR) repeat protein